MTESNLEWRVRRLEDRIAIGELVARYCFAVDDRDIDGLARLFTRAARVRSRDGVMDATGRDAIVAQFHGRFAVLGPSNHFTHDHLIEFDAADPDRARGLVSSHAEVVRNGETLWAALRYDDEYRFEDGAWRFADRLLGFFYYLPVKDYAELMKRPDRLRAYAEPRPADYPESLETWKRYHSK
jgi:ketosteroid isomerase-like protein